MTRPTCDVCGSPVNVAGATRCWRHRPPAKALRVPGPRDPVTEAVAGRVRARDGGCVGPRVGLPGPCDGPLELDHVINGGLSYRGPSTVGNLATLCRFHHRHKTEHATDSRARLVGYLNGDVTPE